MSGEGVARKVMSPKQSRSFWPVAMGACGDRASLQVRRVSGKRLASKVRSPGQSRSFWPIAVRSAEGTGPEWLKHESLGYCPIGLASFWILLIDSIAYVPYIVLY